MANVICVLIVLALAIVHIEARPAFPNYRSNTAANVDSGSELPIVPDYLREILRDNLPRFAEDNTDFASNELGIQAFLSNLNNPGKFYQFFNFIFCNFLYFFSFSSR